MTCPVASGFGCAWTSTRRTNTACQFQAAFERAWPGRPGRPLTLVGTILFVASHVSDTLKCALARRLSIQTTFLRAECYSRSTRADPNVCPIYPKVLSPDTCRSRCISYLFKCALTRPPPTQICVPCVRMCSRTMPVDPDACLICSNMFPLDPHRPKRVFSLFKYVFARRQSFQTHLLRAECGLLCLPWSP